MSDERRTTTDDRRTTTDDRRTIDKKLKCFVNFYIE